MAEAVLPEKIVEAVAVDNVKTVAGQPAVLSNLALANAVSHQHSLNLIAQAATGKIIESIIATSPTEAGGSVATLAQLMKGVSLTPPPVTPG